MAMEPYREQSAESLKGEEDPRAESPIEKNSNDEDDSHHERASGWSFLLDSAREYDQEKLEGWKSDLDNLLVFAALFSGIVTAFSIESYQWLQDDPAQTSVQLLSQISLQLSSFTTGQGFINSTVGSLPPAQPFTPARDDVTINMLWFLSLTLSLLASFFTLAVQQWLRAYVLPKQLSIRDSIRLRQSRYDALLIWQVPNIILFLPVVLQAAVVLFLVGVFLLLRSLSHPIMAAFAIVSGIPFFLYAFSLVLPLVWPSCPFKSPLVPATVVVVNWCVAAIAIASLVFVFVPVVIIGLASRTVFGISRSRTGFEGPREMLRRIAIKVYAIMIYAVQNTGSLTLRIFGQMNDFWSVREVRALAHDKEKALAEQDEYALEWVIQEVPRSQLDRLRPCLSDLPQKERVECVLNWLAVSTGDYDETVYGYADPWSPIDPRFLARLNPAIIHQFKDYLVDVLPKDWESSNTIREDPGVSCALVLLTQMIQRSSVDEGFIDKFTNLLLKVWNSQPIETIHVAWRDKKDDTWIYVPIACLFHVWSVQPAKLTIQETRQMASRTKDHLSNIVDCSRGMSLGFFVTYAIVELATASTAVSLLAVRAQLPTFSQEDRTALQADVDTLLFVFDQYITVQRREIQFVSSLCLDHPQMTSMCCLPKALASISESLATLSDAGLLSGPASTTLVQHLLETCEGRPALQAVATALGGVSFTFALKPLDSVGSALPALTFPVPAPPGPMSETVSPTPAMDNSAVGQIGVGQTKT